MCGAVVMSPPELKQITLYASAASPAPRHTANKMWAKITPHQTRPDPARRRRFVFRRAISGAVRYHAREHHAAVRMKRIQ